MIQQMPDRALSQLSLDVGNQSLHRIIELDAPRRQKMHNSSDGRQRLRQRCQVIDGGARSRLRYWNEAGVAIRRMVHDTSAMADQENPPRKHALGNTSSH